MASTVFIRLPADTTGSLTWLPGATSVAHSAAMDPDALSDVAAACSGAQVVVLAPASRMTLLHAEVPTRNRTRMLQALPYALEEQLAEDVDELHFAAGARDDQGVAVAIVARDQLDTWLSILRAAGIEPDAMVPDVLTLPWQPGRWSVLIDGEDCLVRTGSATGWSTDRASLGLLLGLALGENPHPEQLDVYGQQDDAATVDLSSIGIEPHWQFHSGDTLALLAGHYQAERCIDLLQGGYGRTDETAGALRRWRWAGALAIVLLGVHLGALFAESQRLEQGSQQAARQIETLFRADFPETKRIVDPKVQMQQQLDRLRRSAQNETNSEFLPLLQAAGAAIANASGVQLKRVQYANDRLDLELSAQAFQALDDLKRELASKGLQAEIDSASAEEKGVSGRLRLQRGAS